jgi:hypothetical protein
MNMLAVQIAGDLGSLLSLTLSCTGSRWLYRQQESLDLYFLSGIAVHKPAGYCIYIELKNLDLSSFSRV